MYLDLNCDVGESFGAYQLGADELLLPYVTRVNIACGFHAGDPNVMDQVVRLATQQNVKIGAHPGFPDLQGFGRRNMSMSAQDVYTMVVYQIGALLGFALANGTRLDHVKPHGALYNMANQDRDLANAIAKAIYKVDESLVLVGPFGGQLIAAGIDQGLKVLSEFFADRTYQSDGQLTPRSQPHAVITDPEVAATRVMRMVNEGLVRTEQGTDISVVAETVCVHGDNPMALQILKRLSEISLAH